MVLFYHYTSEHRKDMILNSGVIEEGDDGGYFARHGSGVYGTNIPPTAGKSAIAHNNWRCGAANRETQGRVDFVFEIDIPRGKLQEYFPDSRQVYVHKGPIVLSQYPHSKCYKVLKQ